MNCLHFFRRNKTAKVAPTDKLLFQRTIINKIKKLDEKDRLLYGYTLLGMTLMEMEDE